MTRKELVQAFMLEHRTATTMEINDVAVGGSEGTKRLRELKAEGKLDYTKEKIAGSSQFRYTLTYPPIN